MPSLDILNQLHILLVAVLCSQYAVKFVQGALMFADEHNIVFVDHGSLLVALQLPATYRLSWGLVSSMSSFPVGS